jgi:hypothetical protein
MRKAATRTAIGLLLALVALVPLNPVTGQEPSMPAVCGELSFSTEEDFITHGPVPPDGQTYISDGDLLGRGCVICARNADLVMQLDVVADLGLDAADIIDAERYMVAFSTELDSPNRGQFTAGDLLTTKGAIIPNVALTYRFQSGYDLGLDAVHFVGKHEDILGFLDEILQYSRDDWLQNPDRLARMLADSAIDIWFSTEGTWTPVGAPGFLDGDVLSARDGLVVAQIEVLLPPDVPAGIPMRGVDFGLDAVTSDRAGDEMGIHFSTEILFENEGSFTDGDVLLAGNGIAYPHRLLVQCFEAQADFLGLDAFHRMAIEGPPTDVYLPVILKARGHTIR